MIFPLRFVKLTSFSNGLISIFPVRCNFIVAFRCFDLKTLCFFHHEAPLMLPFHCSQPQKSTAQSHEVCSVVRVQQKQFMLVDPRWNKILFIQKKKPSFKVRIMLETCLVIFGLLLLCCKLLISISCNTEKNTNTQTFFIPLQMKFKQLYDKPTQYLPHCDWVCLCSKET